jgi:hypothetical protein
MWIKLWVLVFNANLTRQDYMHGNHPILLCKRSQENSQIFPIHPIAGIPGCFSFAVVDLLGLS